MVLAYLAIICKSRKQNMAQWYGGEGGGEKGKKKREKNVDQIINHSRQCCIHSHTDTHTHTQCGSNSKSLLSDVINDDTGICIASTGLQSKMRGVLQGCVKVLTEVSLEGAE